MSWRCQVACCGAYMAYMYPSCRTARIRPSLACRLSTVGFAVSLHPQRRTSQWRSPWASGWTLRYTKLVCRHPTPVHRGHGRGLRQSRGYRPEHRKSGESPHSQARKRIGLRDNCWRDGLTCLRISTPNYWLWRHETPDANVPVAERRKTRNSAVESRTCLPAYDSSHAAWNIVIGKQGYHMAACASGRVKPPGDDAQYTTYLQYGRRYTSDDDHHNSLVLSNQSFRNSQAFIKA
jgi:hypothetical protein